MPTHEERATQHTALLTTLGKLEALGTERLRRLDLPNDLNFDQGTPYFEETWRLFRDLAQTPLDQATFSMLNRLNGVAQQTLSILQQIHAFNPLVHGANARAQRDVLLQQVRDIYDGSFDTVMMARASLGHAETDLAQVGEDVRRVLSRTEAMFAEQQAALVAKAATADKILEALRQSAASVGVAQFAGQFEKEANAYKAAARYWLITTIVVGVVTIGFGAWSFAYTLNHVANWTPILAIQLTVSKVIILSVLVSGLVWCGHIYRLNRHNYILNRHRQTALNTFQALVEATDDPQARNAILLQTTSAIFGHQPTGFTEGELEIKGLPTVGELLRSGQ